MTFDSQDEEKRIVIFPKRNKTKDSQPDFTGKVTVDGVTYDVALWDKTSKNGFVYHGGRITPASDYHREPATDPETAPEPTFKPVGGDEIPF